MINSSEKEKQQPANNPNVAPTGNASNLTPHTDNLPEGKQLVSPEGEKYLREVASIEDYPDPQDEQEMDESIEQEKQQQDERKP